MSTIDRELDHTKATACQTFASLLHGLKKLDASIDRITPRQGAVIYSFLQDVDVMLEVVSSTLRLVILHMGTMEGPVSSPGKGCSWESVAWMLSSILVMIVESLDPKQIAHKSLFEGILYLLLQRIGQRLHLITFDRECQASIEANISFSPAPNSAEARKIALTQKSAKLEAKCLIHILEPAMRLAPSFLGSNLSASATAKLSRPISRSRTLTSSNDAPGKAALTVLAKERLQRTLIDAMFGESDAQNEFIEHLTKPRPFPPVSKPPKVDDEDVSSWFQEQVWKLVGWDLLARELDS
jgi:hypothetical protein